MQQNYIIYAWAILYGGSLVTLNIHNVKMNGWDLTNHFCEWNNTFALQDAVEHLEEERHK